MPGPSYAEIVRPFRSLSGWVGLALDSVGGGDGTPPAVFHIYLDATDVGRKEPVTLSDDWNQLAGHLLEAARLGAGDLTAPFEDALGALPGLLGGLTVRMHWMPPFRAAAGPVAGQLTSSTAVSGQNHSGRVGFFANAPDTDGQVKTWMVSANHVWALNGPPGTDLKARCVWVGDPGNLVGGNVTFLKLQPGQDNPIDAAACVVDPGILDRNQLYGANFLSAAHLPGTGDRVQVLGTGSQGTVIWHPQSTFQVRYADAGMRLPDPVTFTGQILVEGAGADFTRDGDSGSLVVFANGQGENQPVGLVIGQAADEVSCHTLVTPVDAILQKLWPAGPGTLI